MALIRSFERTTRERYSAHQEVQCRVSAFIINGRTYLQLDTGGSNSRLHPGKVSQTIQLDLDSASELVAIIRATFPRDLSPG